MKNLIPFICSVCFLCSSHLFFAQESASILDNKPDNYKKRNPIYDYQEEELTNIDTIPGFVSNSNKIKIFGTIYKSDGITPAKNILLYICQADENGSYVLKKHNKKRYVHHRGWVKTNDDGQYAFYSFMPGTILRSKDLKQIHLVIKEPSKPEHNMEPLLFDNDPLLTNSCRTKIEKTGGTNRILKFDKQEGLFVAKRDIILGEDVPTY